MAKSEEIEEGEARRLTEGRGERAVELTTRGETQREEERQYERFLNIHCPPPPPPKKKTIHWPNLKPHDITDHTQGHWSEMSLQLASDEGYTDQTYV